MEFYITKNSGEQELFSLEKFRRSLERAGGSTKVINLIAEKIKGLPELRTTAQIYRYALKELEKTDKGLAGRYNLKKALSELGPAGFPFEQFIARLFEKDGYQTTTGQIITGSCVNHEIDVVAVKDNRHYIIECKFHNTNNLKTNIKVVLYVKARFDDIKELWDREPKHDHPFHEVWVVTNTKFTSQAIQYAQCRQMNLLGWSYPAHENLAQLIDRYGLHPITALSTLSHKDKKEFIQAGFVLCKDARQNQHILKRMGYSESKIKQLIAESESVCNIR